MAAPGFFDFSQEDEYSYSSLKHYTQCVIRDTAEDKKQDYFLLPDTPRITVGDQYTKKEIIRQQIAWGHMPLFLVESELASGELISIENDFIKGIDCSDHELFKIYSREILKQLPSGRGDWEQALPAGVTKAIIDDRLFGFKA